MGPLVRQPVVVPSLPAVPLRVDGTLPEGLDGLFLRADPHPARAPRQDVPDVLPGPSLVSGARLEGGAAHAYRATAERGPTGLLGPVPALAPAWHRDQGPDGRGPVTLARPVADEDGRWHTVATYPGLGYAEHLVADGRGAVLEARPFPLTGAPLVATVALTGSHVVFFDGPVAHSRATALVGERFPCTWRPGGPARLGLLDRTGEPSVRWFPVEPGHVHDIAGAHEDGRRVVVDAVRRPRAFDGERSAARPAALRRWVVDPVAGEVAERDLVPGVAAAAVDGPVLHGTRNTASGAELVRYDTATGRTGVRWLGGGATAGRPHVDRGRLLVPVERPGRRRAELLVLDAADPAGPPAAVVHLPAGARPARRTAWLPAPPRG
ncbi:carotenoid oxygenase family protein [Saccharothrix syringae]|nr:carotenoid oxygenase family protein [Saccharothrix syringae]